MDSAVCEVARMDLGLFSGIPLGFISLGRVPVKVCKEFVYCGQELESLENTCSTQGPGIPVLGNSRVSSHTLDKIVKYERQRIPGPRLTKKKILQQKICNENLALTIPCRYQLLCSQKKATILF